MMTTWTFLNLLISQMEWRCLHGMKRIAEPLKEKVVEIGMDPTCELYLRNEVSTNLQYWWVPMTLLSLIDGNSNWFRKAEEVNQGVVTVFESYWRNRNVIVSWSSWRKGFKKVWRKLEKTPITVPINDAYRTKVEKRNRTCACPYLSSICRQPIPYLQVPDSACAPCPPRFLPQTSRFREPLSWRHESLQPQKKYCIESWAGAEEFTAPGGLLVLHRINNRSCRTWFWKSWWKPWFWKWRWWRRWRGRSSWARGGKNSRARWPNVRRGTHCWFWSDFAASLKHHCQWQLQFPD